MWIATPGEVNDWWRQRAQLRIVENGTGLRIEGLGSERARIAYAEEQMGDVAFSVEGQKLGNQRSSYTEVVSTYKLQEDRRF